jgi:hypothetical protein
MRARVRRRRRDVKFAASLVNVVGDGDAQASVELHTSPSPDNAHEGLVQLELPYPFCSD